MRLYLSFLLLTIICFFGCKNNQNNVNSNPLFKAEGIEAIVEIPAGTNHKIEFNKSSQKFEVDKDNGKDRIINFLPYPGNYGYIPSTLMDAKRGGDGDPLDILVIAEALQTGTKIPVIPIAALELKDGGEMDTKIIAVPADSLYRIIQATDFQSFMIEYDGAKHIIQEWFMSYKGLGKMELVGWRDEKFALQEIKKWKKKDANK